jgi:hypothetical protein
MRNFIVTEISSRINHDRDLLKQETPLENVYVHEAAISNKHEPSMLLLAPKGRAKAMQIPNSNSAISR